MRGARNPDVRPIRLLKYHRNVMRLQSSAASNGEERFPFICLPEPPWNMTITFTQEEEGGAKWQEPQHWGNLWNCSQVCISPWVKLTQPATKLVESLAMDKRQLLQNSHLLLFLMAAYDWLAWVHFGPVFQVKTWTK